MPDLQCSLSKCGKTTFEPSSSSSSFCLAGNGKVSNNSSTKKIESFFLAHFLFHFVLPFHCTRSAFADESFFLLSLLSNNHLNKYMKGAIIIFGIFEAFIFKMMRFYETARQAEKRGRRSHFSEWNGIRKEVSPSRSTIFILGIFLKFFPVFFCLVVTVTTFFKLFQRAAVIFWRRSNSSLARLLPQQQQMIHYSDTKMGKCWRKPLFQTQKSTKISFG